MYFGSADWMTRNLDRRIEVVSPVLDKRLLKTLKKEVLELSLRDNCQSWELQPDGSYLRNSPEKGKARMSAQEALLLKHTGG